MSPEQTFLKNYVPQALSLREVRDLLKRSGAFTPPSAQTLRGLVDDGTLTLIGERRERTKMLVARDSVLQWIARRTAGAE